MNDTTHDNNELAERKQQERREFRSYVWGLGLAYALTLVPFGLVNWKGGIPEHVVFYVIGAFGLVQ